jgi:RNA polymerase sigma factor (sigma-70 family)
MDCSPPPQGNKPPLGQFLQDYEPALRSHAFEVARRFNFKTHPLNFDDLVSQGNLKLIELYRENRIQWENPGIYEFLKRSVQGHIHNFLLKLNQQQAFIVSAGAQDNPDTPPELGDAITPDLAYEQRQRQMEAIEHRQVWEDLKELIDKLSPEDRLILTLRLIDERSCESVGRILGVSRMTVDRRVKMLKKHMIDFLRNRGWEMEEIKGNPEVSS